MLNDKKQVEENNVVDNRHEKPFVENFEATMSENYLDINIKYEKVIERICNSLNYEYEIMTYYFGCFFVSEINHANKLLYTSFHKSLINLQTAMYLNRRSLWGATSPLLRQVFESLIIAKYCSLNEKSVKVFESWVRGEQISLGKIFKEIELSDIASIKKLWGELSDLTHSTIFASQPWLKYGADKMDVARVIFNFMLIEVMLECLYHLLLSHIITPSMTYYLKSYVPKNYERVQYLKKMLRQNCKESKIRMMEDAKKIIQAYKSSWNIKN